MSGLATNFYKRPVILLVDDCSEILALWQAIFESQNFLLKAAENGSIGLKILDENAIDLVLLDMDLGDMNGYEFIDSYHKKVISNEDRVPVVFYSGNENPDIGAAAGSISKSGNIENLIQQVSSFINLDESKPIGEKYFEINIPKSSGKNISKWRAIFH
jgi:response regulator RpfG family c-di-GMP phosphodiesterase